MSTASLDGLPDEELRRRWTDEDFEDAGHLFIAIYNRFRQGVRDELEAAGLTPVDAEARVGSVFQLAQESASAGGPLREVLLTVARAVARDTNWSPP